MRQGDIMRDMVAVLLPQTLAPISKDAEAPALDLELAEGDWIVLSGSCDVEERVDRGHVLLARVLPVTETTLGAAGAKALAEKVEVIRRGWDPARFLLAECPAIDPAFPLSFVQYRSQLLLPIGYVRAHCAGRRLRMLSPFREKLGIWAGAALSRVGIESDQDIPPLRGQLWAAQILRGMDEP